MGPKLAVELAEVTIMPALRFYVGTAKEISGEQVNDPQNYVSWDGIHNTEAANKLLVHSILNGSHFDPPFSLHQLCDIHPIG